MEDEVEESETAAAPAITTVNANALITVFIGGNLCNGELAYYAFKALAE